MGNALEKYRNGNISLSTERRLMNEALARLGAAEMKKTSSPARGQPRGAYGKAGRLMVALDLTGSREHSLKQARIATAAMFDTIRVLGVLAVKLVYFRGLDECRASQWHSNPDILGASMRRLSCEAGYTQIARVLRVALAEREFLSGLVFVGDHCEEDSGELLELAAELGRRSGPLFLFHECADDDGRSIDAKPVFKSMAEASGGIYAEFKPDSGVVLRELIESAGAHAAAGAEGVRRVGLAKTPEGRQLQGKMLLLGPSSEKG
jgi:hypothetical protein